EPECRDIRKFFRLGGRRVDSQRTPGQTVFVGGRHHAKIAGSLEQSYPALVAIPPRRIPGPATPQVKAAEAQLVGQARDQLRLRAIVKIIRTEWNGRHGAITACLIHLHVLLVKIAGVEELELKGKICAVPVGPLVPEAKVTVLVIAKIVQKIRHPAGLSIVRPGRTLPDRKSVV